MAYDAFSHVSSITDQLQNKFIILLKNKFLHNNCLKITQISKK